MPAVQVRLHGQALGRLLGRFAPARFRSVHVGRVARALINAAHDNTPGLRILENAT